MASGRGAVWLAKAGYEHRHYVPAALNGAIGDKLAAAGHPLAIPTSFRAGGADISAAQAAQLVAAGGGHAVVLVHGLMADDVCWHEPGFGAEGLGPQLARELGMTPLYLRYNSGRHISDNGRDLTALLEAVVAQGRPAPRRLTLIGHSMGGLVVRSAGHYGREQGHRWPQLVDSVVLLGTPHDGSWLEQASHLTAGTLRLIASLHTQLIGRLIDERSAGIKDLRLGLLVEDDWRRPDAHALRLHQRTPVPPLPGVDYHIIATTLARDATSGLARTFGDGLVGAASATRGPVPSPPGSSTQAVFSEVAHATQVMRPEVQARVLAALRGPRRLPAPPGG